jgi:hypothetical protein
VRGLEVWEWEVADRWGPRESKGVYANGRSAMTEQAHRAERGSERGRKGTGADNPAPPGSGRERAREHGRRPSLNGGTHLSGEAGAHARPSWAGLGLMGRNLFLFFQGISKCFYFYFLYGFKIKFKQNSNSNNFKHVRQTKE